MKRILIALSLMMGHSSFSSMVAQTPVYLDDVAGNLSFTSNWFLSVQGGMSAFIGKPVGCGDLFDRTKPMLSIGLGKWLIARQSGNNGNDPLNNFRNNNSNYKYK